MHKKTWWNKHISTYTIRITERCTIFSTHCTGGPSWIKTLREYARHVIIANQAKWEEKNQIRIWCPRPSIQSRTQAALWNGFLWPNERRSSGDCWPIHKRNHLAMAPYLTENKNKSHTPFCDESSSNVECLCPLDQTMHLNSWKESFTKFAST